MTLLSQHRTDVRPAPRRLRSLAVAWAALLCTAQLSCAGVTGETASTCEASRDGDGDGIGGCDDPDCHRFAACRLSNALTPDGAVANPVGGQGGMAGTGTQGGGSGGLMSGGGSGGSEDIDD